MKLKEKFNQELVKVHPNIEFGYKMENGCPYDYYLNKDSSFCEFMKIMKDEYPEIFESFKNGKGRELEEKLTPPKMASIASSSRLAYLTFREIKPELFGQITGNKTNYDIIFEGKLKSILNNNFANPNLDVILKSKNTIVFIEVKCQEIFDSHIKYFSMSYKESLEQIFEEKTIKVVPKKEKGKLVDKLEVSDLNVFRKFDIKQSICHILGIYNFVDSKDKSANIKTINKEIEWSSDIENVYFVNLFYNPQKLNDSILTDAYKEVISEAKEAPIEDYFKKLLEYNKVKGEVNFKHRIAYTTDLENGSIELITK
jgi:hypothetical protein